MKLWRRIRVVDLVDIHLMKQLNLIEEKQSWEMLREKQVGQEDPRC